MAAVYWDPGIHSCELKNAAEFEYPTPDGLNRGAQGRKITFTAPSCFFWKMS